MKKLIHILIMFFILVQVHSQSISKQVIGSTGESIANGTYTINFTAGESIVGIIQNGETIHQGFWSGLFNDNTLSVTTLTDFVDQIKLYPNPVINYLNIRFKKNESVNYQLLLSDINGKQVIKTSLNSQNTNNQLDISRLSNGIYVLSISSTETNYKNSFKIVKK
jgi:Secretion system C-terminal sorting domain